MHELMDSLLALSVDIRYLAIYAGGKLDAIARADIVGASSSESDKYEELIVNPTILMLVKQRGEIDCGGAKYVLIRYGNFYQFVTPIPEGHVSICIEERADPLLLIESIQSSIEKYFPN